MVCVPNYILVFSVDSHLHRAGVGDQQQRVHVRLSFVGYVYLCSVRHYLQPQSAHHLISVLHWADSLGRVRGHQLLAHYGSRGQDVLQK